MTTNADKFRFVAEKMGIPEQECQGCPDFNEATYVGDIATGYRHQSHDVPPDLTTPEGADLLMAQLESPNMMVVYRVETDWAVRMEYGSGGMARGTGPNWREALLDATWKMLGGSDDNQ